MRTKIFKRIYFLLIFLYIITIKTNANAQTLLSPVNSNAAYSIRIISGRANTYGYEILKGKKLIIHQPNIPGMQGVKGFKFKADAYKIAALAVSKLSKGIMPPTINIKEMDSLQINL